MQNDPFNKEKIVQQFKEVLVFLEPEWDRSVVESVTRMFREMIDPLDETQLSAAWSSLGRLFASIRSTVPDPATLKGLTYEEFMERYGKDVGPEKDISRAQNTRFCQSLVNDLG